MEKHCFVIGMKNNKEKKKILTENNNKITLEIYIIIHRVCSPFAAIVILDDILEEKLATHYFRSYSACVACTHLDFKTLGFSLCRSQRFLVCILQKSSIPILKA